ncbi:uncharacterized protein LY89DRAFT_744879 [Mollisia scopiformis]|uniref:Uncharacterized protein n=1 Tax=Mollisia scopiformis TaxID=149040 RepID=A0A194XVB4_MOLSC|nr:uncharacterized protein LY89DRAFT_744879 [Mollisia scopiformis]KUJ24153.1 hypothetical protein LY89DRAFT_744879 [Mollisia scopiformis]
MFFNEIFASSKLNTIREGEMITSGRDSIEDSSPPQRFFITIHTSTYADQLSSYSRKEESRYCDHNFAFAIVNTIRLVSFLQIQSYLNLSSTAVTMGKMSTNHHCPVKNGCTHALTQNYRNPYCPKHMTYCKNPKCHSEYPYVMSNQRCKPCTGREEAERQKKEDEKKALEAKKEAEKEAKAKSGKKDDKNKYKKN